MCIDVFVCVIAESATPVEYETYTENAGPTKGMNSTSATLALFKKIESVVGDIPWTCEVRFRACCALSCTVDPYAITAERIAKIIPQIKSLEDRFKPEKESLLTGIQRN
jgi:hypothetical protein